MRTLTEQLVDCRLCDRLVAWREKVSVEKRASFRDEDYWGRPVPGFGDPAARLVVVGLAPAAHGANRTGRMFTGDRSGDWLYRAMYRSGFASQPASLHAGDGLELRDAWVTSAVRCAPPKNAPLPVERDNCAVWFDRELDLLENAKVFVCLGNYGYTSMMRRLVRRGDDVGRPRPRFGHGTEVRLPTGSVVLMSYHPSQQNTFTGRLTEPMLDHIFERARSELLEYSE